MKSIKINQHYSFDLDQFVSFRTVILAFVLTSFLIRAIRTFIVSLSNETDLLFAIGVLLLAIGAYIFWVYHDFILKNTTYHKNNGEESKYENYSLEEILVELQEVKNKSLIYIFYKKVNIEVIKKYYLLTNINNVEPGKTEEEVCSILKDYFDESYLVKKQKGVITLEEAKQVIRRDINNILYVFFTISEKYDSQNQLNYKDLMAQLELSPKDKKILKATVKEVHTLIKKQGDFSDSFIMYTETEKTNLLLPALVINWISTHYYAKEKFDVFRIGSFILFPLSAIFTLFGE